MKLLILCIHITCNTRSKRCNVNSHITIYVRKKSLLLTQKKWSSISKSFSAWRLVSLSWGLSERGTCQTFFFLSYSSSLILCHFLFVKYPIFFFWKWCYCLTYYCHSSNFHAYYLYNSIHPWHLSCDLSLIFIINDEF